MHGGGWMWRPLVDVSDVAGAQIACLEAPADAVRGQIFNVVQDNYQVRELAMLVAGSVMLARGNVTLELAPEPPLVRNYRCSNDKLFQALGFRPKRSVLESVDEMVARFTQPGIDSLTHPRYYNIDWMLLLIEVHAGLHPFEYVFRRGEGQRLAV